MRTKNTPKRRQDARRRKANIADTARQLVALVGQRVNLGDVHYLTISRSFVGMVFTDASEWPDFCAYRNEE